MKAIPLILIISSIHLFGEIATSTSYWHGDRYVLTVDTSEFEKETEWNPSSGAVPLSADSAMTKVKEWMEENLPHHTYNFARISLVNHAKKTESNHWVWWLSVKNGKEVNLGKDNQGRDMLITEDIEFMVKLDGTLLAPSKTQR